jgi:MFS family permease
MAHAVDHVSLMPPLSVVLVGLTMSFALLGDALLYVALPASAAELGLPLWAVGLLLGANRLVRLITNTLAARMFGRFGGRWPMVSAAIGAVVTTTMYGAAPAFPALLVARAGWGTCFSILRLGAFTTVIGASVSANRGRLVGIYQSHSRLGPVLSLLIGGVLIELVGYHTTFLLLGLATLPAIPLALSLRSDAFRLERPKRSKTGDSQVTVGVRDWLGTPRLVAVKIGMLVNGFIAHGVVISTVSLALTQVADSIEGAAAIAGILVATRWGFDLFLAAPLGHLSDRVGRARMIPALLFGEALAVGALAMAGSRPSVIVATLTVFLIATALTAASDAAAGDLAPTGRRAEVMSSYADWIDIGSANRPATRVHPGRLARTTGELWTYRGNRPDGRISVSSPVAT